MPREERYKHKVTEHQVSFTTQQLDRMREDYLNTKAMEISRQEAAALRLQPNSVRNQVESPESILKQHAAGFRANLIAAGTKDLGLSVQLIPEV
jgi:hypothetical protein